MIIQKAQLEQKRNDANQGVKYGWWWWWCGGGVTHTQKHAYIIFVYICYFCGALHSHFMILRCNKYPDCQTYGLVIFVILNNIDLNIYVGCQFLTNKQRHINNVIAILHNLAQEIQHSNTDQHINVCILYMTMDIYKIYHLSFV